MSRLNVEASLIPGPGQIVVGGASGTVKNALTPLAPHRVLPLIFADGTLSTGIQVLGDSTGYDAGRWVDLLTHDMATMYPAYEVRYYLWDTNNQLIPPVATVLQAPGTARGITYTGVSGQGRTWAATFPAGDLDLRLKMQPSVWPPASQASFITNFNTSGTRAFRFYAGASGHLYFDWTTDGTTLQTAADSGAWTPPAGAVWVRVTFKANNGASGQDIKFYSSTDGNTWTQIGSTTTRAGTTPIFATTQPFEISSRGTTVELFVGRIFEVQVRNGIGGPMICPGLPEFWSRSSSASNDADGTPILSVINGSHPGANIAYLADTTRLTAMTPNYGQVVAIVSSSHNETTADPSLAPTIASYLSAIRGKLPYVTLLGLTQNPRISPATGLVGQNRRRFNYIAWAQNLGWVPIDTYAAFMSDPRGLSDLVQSSDGIHPTSDGSRVWANTVEAALGLA